MNTRGSDAERAKAVDATSAPVAPNAGARSSRTFWLGLGGVLFLGLLTRVVILHEYWTGNPLSQTPIIDAETYWEWAARVAGGEFVGDTPFLSAPLYPYALGLIRAGGGGLLAVYVIQLVLHLLTAGCVGGIGRTRFGTATGLLACVLFLLATEPVYDSTRLLNSTLQLLLVCLLWMQLMRIQRRTTLTGCIGGGALLGVNCLANPPMLLLFALAGGWVLLQADRWRRRLVHATTFLAAALAVTAAATVHNFRACGEFIPITAHSGITFRQGNAPGAQGTYTEIPGIAPTREHMHADALRVYQREANRPARWRDVDRYFRDQGFEYWRSDPWGAVKLAVRKLRLFLTTRHHSDIYRAAAEIKAGLAPWLGRFAPLPTALLMGPALVALLVMLRRPIRFGPEWMLFAVPLFVVVVFWYSPRYRIPAVPVLAVAGAWALVQAVQWRTHWCWSLAVTVLIAASVAVGILHRQTNFDPLRPQVRHVRLQVASVLFTQGRIDEGEAAYRKLIRPNRPSLDARRDLAHNLLEAGRLEQACAEFQAAYAFAPDDVRVVDGLVQTLLKLHRITEAEEILRRAARTMPDEPAVVGLLGHVRVMKEHYARVIGASQRTLAQTPADLGARLALARVLVSLQRWDEARREFETILEALPTHRDARYELGRILLAQGKTAEARVEFDTLLQAHPRDADVLCQLGVVCAASGQLAEASHWFRKALEVDPNHDQAAWMLRKFEERDKR